jgi:small conductance mechanosensitive channel
MSLLETLRAAALNRVAEIALGLGKALPDLVLALAILTVGLLVARAARSSVRRVLARTSTEGHVDFVVGRLAFGVVVTITIGLALGQLGVSPAALVAGLGLAGFAIGFALRDVIGPMLAGIVVLMSRPFTIGDRVRIDDVEGTVSDIRVRDTIIRAIDGTLIYLSNDRVYTARIANLTVGGKRRAEVQLAVDLAADVEGAMRTAQGSLVAIEPVLAEPPPTVVIDSMMDGAARFTARFWLDVKAADFTSVRTSVALALKKAMEDAGVTLK